jgi:tetratricopeptide (TPR) repeat protein
MTLFSVRLVAQRLCGLLLAAVLLSACSGPLQRPPEPGDSVPPKTPPLQEPAPGDDSAAPLPAPTPLPQDNLLARAQQSAEAGQPHESIALLERALRIAPRDARIYARLAASYAADGRHSQAAATAERGLLYCQTAAECDALRPYIP